MFCSGCGQALTAGQTFCPRCGRAVAPPVPPVPNLHFQLANYSGRIRALSIFWFIYGGLSLALGILGIFFANEFLHGGFSPWMNPGPWAHGHTPPMVIFSFILRFAWAFLIVRTALAFIAGWGLMERASWGRVVAIVAAIFNILKFPIGTALGIWTLVTLLGYRNATLYDQL